MRHASPLIPLALIAALPAAALPMAAQALTPQELLAAQNNFVSRLGFTPLGRLAQDGDTMEYVDLGGRMVLPFNWGDIGWSLSPIPVTEADGVVTQDFDGVTLTADFRPHARGSKPGMAERAYTTVFTLSGDNLLSHASGTADAITILTNVAETTLTLTAADWWARMVEGPGGAPVITPQDGPKGNGTPELSVTLQDWQGHMVLNGFTAENTGLAMLFSEDLTSSVSTRYAVAGPDVSDTGTTRQEDAFSTITLNLPANPPGLSTFAAALREGLAVTVESGSAATRSDGMMESAGSAGRSAQTSGATTSRLSLDAAKGLSIAGSTSDITFEMLDPELFDDAFGAQVAGLAFALDLPFMANGAREKALLSLDVTEARIDPMPFFGDEIAGLADLPLSLGLTLGADYEPLRDLPEIGGFVEIVEEQDVLRIYDFGVDRLDLRYGEASLTGSGRVGWGLNGAVMNNQLAQPKGSGVFTLTGAYGLIERLVTAGLLDAGSAAAARGAIAGFGLAKGPDVVESTIRLGPDGLTINGIPAPF